MHDVQHSSLFVVDGVVVHGTDESSTVGFLFWTVESFEFLNVGLAA